MIKKNKEVNLERKDNGWIRFFFHDNKKYRPFHSRNEISFSKVGKEIEQVH